MNNKVDKVIKRLYIDPDTFLLITHMFYARKVLNDIQMIYNGTSCGLNLSLWAPHFGLTVGQHIFCALLPGYSQCEMDVGEMLLNFPHPPLFETVCRSRHTAHQEHSIQGGMGP